MTLLYCSDIRFPLERANGIQAMETCAALAWRGHDVHLLVRPDTADPARDPLAFYDVPPTPRLRIERAPVIGPPAARRAAYLAAALDRMLERRWDVVLTRDLGVADAALRCPARLRPPVVYESHGYAPVFAATRPELVAGARAAGPGKRRRLRRRERRVWRRAEGYVTTTGVLAAELRTRFGPRPRIMTAPNGVRLDPARPGPPSRRGDPPVVAYAGHFYPWKGADVLIEALARLPAVRGLLVGGHPAEDDGARLAALARDRGVADRVTFAGLVPRRGVPARLRGADVLVLPTVDTPSARYTSPLKLFEYLAAGRPIVASDLPPVREIVGGGQAVLVAPGDPDALAAGIRTVLGDPAAAARIARAAFDRAAGHAWARRAERLDRILRVAAGSRAEAGSRYTDSRLPRPPGDSETA